MIFRKFINWNKFVWVSAMKFCPYFLFLCSLCLLWSCQQDLAHPENRINLRKLSAHEQELVRSVNNFSFDLFKEISLKNTAQNLFISPFSVNMALSMTLNGADSTTLQQMQKGLGYETLERLEINKAFNEFNPFLQQVDGKVNLSLANTAWFNQNLEIQPLFRDMMVAYYHAGVEGLDFSTPKATKTINKWIENETDGKVKELVKNVASDEVVYLVSTIHFKGDWTFPFNKEMTKLGTFYFEDGKSVTAEMMFTDKVVYRYYNDQRKTLIDIPYGNLQYSMTVLLPHQGDSIAGIIQSLSASELQENLAHSDTVSYHLQMPKFTIRYSTELKDPLSGLGMKEAFHEKASFPGFSPSQPAWITNVLHNASIEVDEKGTEASAAAGAIIQSKSGGNAPSVSLNRPFVFFIRENHSGAILFAGMLTNPVQ